MQLENPTPDESVNYAIEHPLKEFAWLVGGVFAVAATATALVSWFAGDLAALLPYRYEKEFADGIGARLEAGTQSDAAREAQKELDELVAQLALAMELPNDFQVTLHLNEGPLVNAYATLGANIVVYRGLLTKLPDENTLAMVLAHEMAHAKLRHPVKSLGRGVAVGIILTVISASVGRGAAGDLTAVSGSLTLLKFSRDQEREADALALQALARYYGHIGGAHDVFRLLQAASERPEAGQIEMLSTHPLSTERIDHITRLAVANGWPADGARKQLPSALAALSSGGSATLR